MGMSHARREQNNKPFQRLHLLDAVLYLVAAVP